MKLPAGIAPGAGRLAGGRRLAVGFVHLGSGLVDDGFVGGAVAARAARLRRTVESELVPHAAIATLARASASS
jgi:hypothetical protein